jgi:hypothetical protein
VGNCATGSEIAALVVRLLHHHRPVIYQFDDILEELRVAFYLVVWPENRTLELLDIAALWLYVPDNAPVTGILASVELVVIWKHSCNRRGEQPASALTVKEVDPGDQLAIN